MKKYAQYSSLLYSIIIMGIEISKKVKWSQNHTYKRRLI